MNANFRLSTEAHSLFNGGLNGHFEDLSLASRPSELVRQYGDLYSRIRVDALDALDKIGQLDDLSVLKEKILFSVVVVRGSYEIPITTSRTLPADLKKNVTLVGKTCREVAIVMFPFELNDHRSLKLNVNVISVIVFNIFNSYPFGEPNKRFMNSGARCDICSTFRIPTPIETSLIRSVITWRSKLRNTYARQQETLTFRWQLR